MSSYTINAVPSSSRVTIMSTSDDIMPIEAVCPLWTSRNEEAGKMRKRLRVQCPDSLFSSRWSSSKRDGGKRSSAIVALTLLIQAQIALVKATTLPPNIQQQQRFFEPSSTLQERDEASPSSSSSSSNSDGHLSITHNVPLQLVVIVFSVVVFAMFLGSLAWLCRRGSCGGSKKRRKAKSWSPSGNGGVFATSAASDSSSMLSAEEKRRSKNSDAKDLYSPLPKLKKDRTQRQSRTEREMEKEGIMPAGDKLTHMPELPLSFRHADQIVGAAMVEQPTPTYQPAKRGARGWQLYDGPVPALPAERKRERNEDVEAAGLPPARRPTFVQRLLQQRADSLAEFPAGIDDADAPATPPELSDSNRKRRGQNNSSSNSSVLLSVLSGSLHVIPNSLRNVTSRSNTAAKLNAKQSAAVRGYGADNSDFEGTIGGRDRDLPMAKRIGAKESRRLMLCDAASTDEATTAPIDHFLYPQAGLKPPHMPMAAMLLGTPKTPGLAGVGSVWHRQRHEQQQQQQRMGVMTSASRNGLDAQGPRAPTLAELKRQEALFEQGRALQFGGGMQIEQEPGAGGIQRWIQMASAMAEPLSPAPLSRHGSVASTFLSSIVNGTDKGQNVVNSRRLLDGVVAQQRQTNLQQPERAVERVPSIRPHFIATTTLQSWLAEDAKERIQELDEEAGGEEGMSSILNQYYDDDQATAVADGDDAKGGSRRGAKTRNLWEKDSLASGSLRSRSSTAPGRESSNGHPPSYRTREHDSSSFTLSSAETAQIVEAQRTSVPTNRERAHAGKDEAQRIKESRRRRSSKQGIEAAGMPTYEEATKGSALAYVAVDEKAQYDEARKEEKRAARRREREQAGWSKEDEAREQERREVERRIKDKRRAEKRERRRARQLAAEQEQQQEQQMVAQSAAASRPRKKTSIEELDNLASRNAPWLSPPESPLTSASEGHAREDRRRVCSASTVGTKEFLVEKRTRKATAVASEARAQQQQRRRKSGVV